MAAAIVNFEARRDSKRHLMVYKLPKGDGGGRYEVAGINERYNKDTVDVLVSLIDQRRFDEAEALAADPLPRILIALPRGQASALNSIFVTAFQSRWRARESCGRLQSLTTVLSGRPGSRWPPRNPIRGPYSKLRGAREQYSETSPTATVKQVLERTCQSLERAGRCKNLSA
jgi:hypothetical protein